MFTKWKINSVRYAHLVLLLIAILTIVLPTALYLLYRLIGMLRINVAALLLAMRISFVSGMIFLALFVLVLIIEAVHDHFLNQHYAKIKSQRLRLAGGYYECPYCGCQRVREFDRCCPVCSKELG